MNARVRSILNKWLSSLQDTPVSMEDKQAQALGFKSWSDMTVYVYRKNGVEVIDMNNSEYNVR